jgi:hypothetical protein
MNEQELVDHLEDYVQTYHRGPCITGAETLLLLRLARRGLRAERETCGTCVWWLEYGPQERKGDCTIADAACRNPHEFCSRWEAKR